MKYEKLIFDHYPNEVSGTKNLFKSDKFICSNNDNAITENKNSNFFKFSTEKEMETPILKSSMDLQFHKECIEIKNYLRSNDNCFQTLKRLYKIKLPKKFLEQDAEKENNNNNNNLIEINEDNLINHNEIKKTSQENENNLSINIEINVSGTILK